MQAYPKSSIRILAGLLAALVTAVSLLAEEPQFLAFESGQVRPLALAPDGSSLFAVNTPDNRLEVFEVDGEGLRHAASVPVGMEPVAVAVRDEREVWVVNHLSDSVSIVDVAAETPRVVGTLLVGDEPSDVVFAGSGPNGLRAFVTTAHRGQHRIHPSLAGVPGAGDPRLTSPGVARADVWVFDVDPPSNAGLGGRPVRILELFGDTPRALAVSPDGKKVYAAVLRSGNRTATVPEQAVCDGFRSTEEADACPEELAGMPGGLPSPDANHAGAPAPEVGLIVHYDAASDRWLDELGRDWSNALRFDLPDFDVFTIDAATLEQTAAISGVGTVLFNMAVNPVDGTLYVSNTEANNAVRFEGDGASGHSTVQGHLARSRITVVRDGRAAPRHLNKHLDYSVRPALPGQRRHSLATPLGMAVSADGETLYVAAFGSSKIGVFPTDALEDDSFEPSRLSESYIAVSGGGPSGLVLDEPRGRLYVLTRFDNALATVDLAAGREIAKVALHNPEPSAVVDGRRFLYDAFTTSSNGEASCAACHVFGDQDGLAWDLGDPGGDVTRSPISILREEEAAAFTPPINGTGDPRDFHPMKGPMTTQTLRGLTDTGALHWRGDRATGDLGTDQIDAEVSMLNFAAAFSGLLGRRNPLPERPMQKLTDFVLALVHPPNPVRALDNSLTPRQAAGQRLFATRLLAGGVGDRRCNNCHIVDPLAGAFGTAGRQAFSSETQLFKVPHLRNLYQKVGMFGTPLTDFYQRGNDRHRGDQVRGFGFLHDGSVDTVFRFLQAVTFNEDETGATGFRNNRERRDLERFLLAFDSDLAPVVGQQVTVTAANAAAARERVELMVERAEAPFVSKRLGGTVTECDLIVKAVVGGAPRGGLYDPVTRRFTTDRAGEPEPSLEDVLGLAGQPGQELTFTCAPPGSGRRMGLDRDGDGFFDQDETDAGSDPADPSSLP